MSTSSAARIGFVEEACIRMGTKYHVTCFIDYDVIWTGSNIVEEESTACSVATVALAWWAAMALRATSSLFSIALA